MRLYDNAMSGNCYKVRLLLAQLGIAYERLPVSVADRSDRAQTLGELNPGLRIPTLVFDDGRALGESDAILFPSPTSRSTPTPTWRKRAGSRSHPTPRSGHGWRAWPRSPGTSRSTPEPTTAQPVRGSVHRPHVGAVTGPIRQEVG